MGCDFNDKIQFQATYKFQSTHPSWGATEVGYDDGSYHKISIHAPIVGCDILMLELRGLGLLFQSTHPSWGATLITGHTRLKACKFQSTHPSWGATSALHVLHAHFKISIHAPIVGCDRCYLKQ